MRTVTYEECPECGGPMRVTSTRVLAEKTVISRDCQACGRHGIETVNDPPAYTEEPRRE